MAAAAPPANFRSRAQSSTKTTFHAPSRHASRIGPLYDLILLAAALISILVLAK